MKLNNLLATTLIFFLLLVSFLNLSVSTLFAQETNKLILQRGYRTGYSDGYMAGYRDSSESSSPNLEKHPEYAAANRAYRPEYGPLPDYRDGYQQGFENGYVTGFAKKNFTAAVPADLKRRSAQTDQTAAAPPKIIAKQAAVQQPAGEAFLTIPAETELVIELLGNLDTELNKEGDKFQARVVSPAELDGALVEGRIVKIQKPGRIKRRAEMSLSFDRIVLSESRWSNYSAILLQVLPVKGDNVGSVDVEGSIQGQSSIKGDIVKVGGATGAGAVTGAIVGGPVGAAVGAGVGAAFGVGSVVVERGKQVKLTKGQQLKIKTAIETRIR